MRTKLKLFSVCFLLMALLFSFVVPGSPGMAEGNKISNVISRGDVEKTVNAFINTKREIFNVESKIKLKLVSELYGLDDAILAYYYNIFEDGVVKGYILASGDVRIDPIIEYGSIENGIDDYYGELLKENKQLKAYYLGVQDIRFSKNSKQLNSDLKKEKEEAVNKLLQSNEVELAGKIRSLEVGLNYSAAEKLKADGQSDSIGTLAVGPVTLPVTRVYQRLDGVANPGSSCGPASGAMITNYYKSSRGFNVRNYTYYKTNANFINHLYFDMNSSYWGTNAYSFGMGLQLHLNHDMTGWKIVSSGSPGYNTIVGAINGKYPVGAVWLVLSGENYHWRVINGYDSDSGQYVSYKDPDGGSTNTGNHWVSWSSIYDKINTVYLSR